MTARLFYLFTWSPSQNIIMLCPIARLRIMNTQYIYKAQKHLMEEWLITAYKATDKHKTRNK